MLENNHHYWMEQAFKQAELAYGMGEVPVGAIIVFDQKIIGKGYNYIELLQDPTAHAEMIAITAAAEHLSSRRLLDTTLYVTLEPCSMCAGAIVLARIPNLVIGAKDPKAGACGTVINLVRNEKFNHRTDVIFGVLEKKCSLILSDFFRKLRETN